MNPEIILGPPGCGKTKTILDGVDEELARGVPPDRIGLITFTRRGAGEAVERACTKFNLSRSDFKYFRTIHSLCFRAAGLSGGDVLEGQKLVEFGDWLGVKVSPSVSMEEGTTFGYEPGDRALFMENLARVRCVPLRQQYDADDDGLPWNFVERVGRGLREYKRDRGLVDYTDMLQMFVEGDWIPTLDALFVDEAQDLSELQWRVVWKLASGVWARGGRVTVAGDDDQAIYKWAGAAVDSFVGMDGSVRVLGQSWRVPQCGQAVAHDIISRVSHRRPKEWRARPEAGVLSRVQSFSEIDVMKDQDLLILGRNAVVLRPVMEHLRREGAIFEWRGHSSVSRATLEAIVSWERLRKGETISASEARVVYSLMSSGKGVKRGFKTLPQFRDEDEVSMKALIQAGGLMVESIWHEALDRVPQDERLYMLRARQKGESLQKRPRVRVSTMHAIKGGEADHVVVLRDMAPRSFDEMRGAPDDEARVWYVAATRFRQQMTVVAPRTRFSYDI